MSNSNNPFANFPPKKPRRKTKYIVHDEYKYTLAATGVPDWYLSDDIPMVLPLKSARLRGVDLRSLPGYCDIFMKGLFRWNSNITSIMAAQALWKATQKYQEVSIELEQKCLTVSLKDTFKINIVEQ